MRVNLFGGTLKSKSPNLSAQQRINCYVELQRDGERGRVAILRTPGLTSFVDFGDTPIRGAIEANDKIYLVHRSKFYEVNAAGVTTDRGTIGTASGRVGMAFNGTQIMIVDGVAGYIYTLATTTLATIADADFPNGCRTVTWQNNRFIVELNSSFYISALDDGTSWDALDFATAESSPDDLVRVDTDRGEIILFGGKTTEFWGDSGALDFPYIRIGNPVEVGLAARWSVAKFLGSVAFLAKNKLGEVQICTFNGYAPAPFSTPELESLINQYSVVSDATGFSYRKQGNDFYQINFPTAGKSWLFCAGSSAWSELQSSGSRHRADIAVDFRARTYVTDYENGRLYELDADNYTENGISMPAEVVTKHQFQSDWITISRLWLDIESGVGLITGQGASPQIMLQASHDGGHTWDNERWQSMGKIGEYLQRAIWWRLGRHRSFTFRFRVSDPVKVVILGAWMDAQGGRNWS